MTDLEQVQLQGRINRYDVNAILCLTSRTTVTSAHIPDEDSCYGAHNLHVFSCFQKRTPGFTHKGCVLQCESLGALSDVTVVFGMIITIDWYLDQLAGYIPAVAPIFVYKYVIVQQFQKYPLFSSWSQVI